MTKEPQFNNDVARDNKILKFNQSVFANQMAEGIRKTLENRRKEISLSFREQDHTYFMTNEQGQSKFPSVSDILKNFHKPFNEEKELERMSKGDPRIKLQLKKKWSNNRSAGKNIGSKVHYNLEKLAIHQFGYHKTPRTPFFEIDKKQLRKSNSMINAGSNFLSWVQHVKGAILLDTEMVLGDPELGYAGQPDKVWLVQRPTGYRLVITDWKTNKPGKFQIQSGSMKDPFSNLGCSNLNKCYLQLSFYAKLLSKMLQGTKYENLQVDRCYIILLQENSSFRQFKVPDNIKNKVMDMNMNVYLAT